MVKFKMPKDVANEAKENNVPNFKRVTPVCCYSCKFSTPKNGLWICARHSLTFGIGEVNGISNMIEFMCDDFSALPWGDSA